MITHYASITRHLRVMVFNAFIVTLVINVTKPAPIEKRSSEPRRNVNSLGRTPPSRLRGGLGACIHTHPITLNYFKKKCLRRARVPQRIVLYSTTYSYT